MTNRHTILIVFVVIMALAMITSPIAMAAGGAVAGADTGASEVDVGDLDADGVQTQSGDDVRVTSELEEEVSDGDTVEVFVRLDAADSAIYADATDGAQPTSDSQASLEQEAAISQTGIETYADATAGIDVVSEFWITNAVLLEIDTAQVGLDDITQIDGVTELHPNYEVEHVEPVEAETINPNDAGADFFIGDTTYGVNHVNAPSVWEEFDTKGEGVTVAVADTGVNADHELFEDYDEDNWAEFDFDGTPIDSDPYDVNGHGTHVAGTVLGGEAPTLGGITVGVAPDAELLAINVFPGMPEQPSTTLAAIVAGLEHAVDEDADVVNFSLGGDGFAPIYIDAIQNAKAAGTHVVSSSGNAGIASDGTPANVYNATAVGASDADRDIAIFSTGTEVDTAAAWGYVAPDDWPDEYVTPDVSAPGVDVASAYAGDDDAYFLLQGTSMAAPHVTGVVALMMAEHDTDPSEVKGVLEETATKPTEPGAEAQYDAFLYDDFFGSDQFDRLFDDEVRDIRYGYGIVDAYAALAHLAEETGTVEGSVTEEGDPVAALGVTMQNAETGAPLHAVETDMAGEFSVELLEGEYDFAAATFGYGAQETVTVDGDGPHELDLELEPIVDAAVAVDQPGEIASGDAFTVGIDVANVENYTVDLGDASTVGEEDVTVEMVEFDGNEYEPDLGEAVTLSTDGEPISGTVNVTVGTDADAGEEIYLDHEVDHDDEVFVIADGPTVVLPSDAESADVEIAMFDPPTEAMLGDATLVGAMFTNPGDFTESEDVFLFVDDEDGTLIPAQVELGPGESAYVDIGNMGWNPDLRGDVVPGDVDMQVSVGEPPELHDEENDPIDQSDVETISVYAGGSISGTVTDAGTYESIAGAAVTAIDDGGAVAATTTTDGDGEYALSGLMPGEYTVLVDHPPTYAESMDMAEIEADEDEATLDVELGSDPIFDLEMTGGQAHALGVPGPVEGGTVGDVVDPETEGVIWSYDAGANQWEMADVDDEIDPLDALVVIPDDDATATVEFAGQPGDDLGSGPGATDEVAEGWAFVAPAVFAEPEDAFLGNASVDGVMDFKAAPSSPMLPDGGFSGFEPLGDGDDVNPFAGYFVSVEESGNFHYTIYEGITRDAAYANLNVDADRTTGTVTGAVSGEPIEGATVSMPELGYETTTAEDGSYVLPALPEDAEYEVVVGADEHVPDAGEFAPGEHDFSLQEEVYFTVTDVDVDETDLAVGDEFTVEYTIENEGVETGDQQVEIAFGMDVEDPRMDPDTYAVDTRTVVLGPGDEETVSVTETVGDFQPYGDQQIGVLTTDDVASVDVTVAQPPTAELSDLDIADQGEDATITEGDDEDVSVELANVGDEDGSFDVSLVIGDEVDEEKTDVEVDAGDSTTVTFEDVTGDLDADEYEVVVSTDHDAIVGELTVEAEG